MPGLKRDRTTRVSPDGTNRCSIARQRDRAQFQHRATPILWRGAWPNRERPSSSLRCVRNSWFYLDSIERAARLLRPVLRHTLLNLTLADLADSADHAMRAFGQTVTGSATIPGLNPPDGRFGQRRRIPRARARCHDSSSGLAGVCTWRRRSQRRMRSHVRSGGRPARPEYIDSGQAVGGCHGAMRCPTVAACFDSMEKRQS